MTEVTSSSTIPLPPRLLVAIFRVDIYYERGLGRSNIAFKKLGRTALNHDRIINHDCLNTCRKDRSTGKILLDDFHLCFLGKRLVSLNFLIKLRKLITKGRRVCRRDGRNVWITIRDPIPVYNIGLRSVENDAVTGRYFDWCVCVFFLRPRCIFPARLRRPRIWNV